MSASGGYRRDLPDGVEGPPEPRCDGCCRRSVRRLTAGYLREQPSMDPVAARGWAELHLWFGREATVAEVDRLARDHARALRRSVRR